jgi:hypothetical protein
MSFINRQRDNLYRLGEIFLDTGIVDVSAVSEGLALAKRTSFPIGRVLVMTGWLDEHDINCALEVQSLLREGAIDKPLAKELLRFSHLNKVDISESFRLNGLSRGGDQQSRLGRLVLASGIVNEERLSQASREASRHCIPLGSALVMLKAISPKTYDGLLNLQIMLRDKKVAFPDAIRFVIEMHERQVSLREVLGDHGKFLRQNSAVPRLGELLVSAQLVSARNVSMACELGTEQDESIGRVLLQQRFISEHALESAVKLQYMITSRVYTYRRAVKLLRMSARMGVPVEQIAEESQVLDEVFTLLRRTEVVSEKLVREVASQIVDFEDTVAEAMMMNGHIKPIYAKIGLACLDRIRKGLLSEAKAAFVMQHCFKYSGQEWEMFSRVNWSHLKGLDVQYDLLGH